MLTRSPALRRRVSAEVTPATNRTLPSSTVANTTAAALSWFGKVVAVALDQLRYLPGAILKGGDEIQRPLAGNGFDAPYPSGHAAFGDDLEQTDVADPADMGTAAQFGGKIAHPQYPHPVAVFFAE